MSSSRRVLFQRVLDRVRAVSLSPVVVRPEEGVKGSKAYRPAVTAPALQVLLDRAQAAVTVAALAGSSRPDGWGSMTPGNGNPGGGKGGRRMLSVPGEEGEGRVLVPSSSTEAAAFAALAGSGGVSDASAVSAMEVSTAVHVVAHALEGLESALARFDRVRSVSKVPDPPMCWVAQVRYRLPWDVMWSSGPGGGELRSTTFAGQLDEPFDEPRRVCGFVYRFVHNHGRLPERDEMLAHLERTVVRVKVPS